MIRSAPWRLGALAAVVLLVSGCTPGADPVYTELDRPQVDSDIFPEDKSEFIDTDSIRLVGGLDGRSFYLGLPKVEEIENGICILVAGEDVPDGAVGGCSGPNATTGYPFGKLRHNPEKIPDSAIRDGWVRISNNLVFQPT